MLFICYLLLMFIVCAIFTIEYSSINPIFLPTNIFPIHLITIYLHISLLRISKNDLGRVPGNIGKTLQVHFGLRGIQDMTQKYICGPILIWDT